MSNCPKCGNPLQEGVTTCPICGTNINNNNKDNSEVVSQETVANTNVSTTQTALENNSSVSSNEGTLNSQILKEPVTPNTETKVETKVEVPVVPQNNNVVQVSPTLSNQPVIPSSLTSQTDEETMSVPANIQAKKEKKHFKLGKKTVLIILAVVIVFGGLSCFMFINNKNSGNKANNGVNNNVASVAKINVSTNGYNLKMNNDWDAIGNGTGLVITNPDESIAIKIVHSLASIDTVNKEMIENLLKNNSNYNNPSVNETSINAKKAYLVNTKVNDYPVQIYIISGGKDLMLGATIVYQSDETKNKLEANVTELIGSLSYEDETAKALDTLEMYNNIFSIYDDIVSPKDVSFDNQNDLAPGSETEQPVLDNQTPQENIAENENINNAGSQEENITGSN